MRIIAGRAKGRSLVGPRGLDTRPLTGRAREALFSSLGSAVAGAAVLDLYAGSGSLGLEALSRGASSAVFVERDRRAVIALRTNVAAVGLGGTIQVADVEAYLGGSHDDFDLVFVDPPYRLDEAELGEVLFLVAPRCRAGGVIVVHRRHGSPRPATPDSLRLHGARRYGDVELWRFVKEGT